MFCFQRASSLFLGTETTPFCCCGVEYSSGSRASIISLKGSSPTASSAIHGMYIKQSFLFFSFVVALSRLRVEPTACATYRYTAAHTHTHTRRPTLIEVRQSPSTKLSGCVRGTRAAAISSAACITCMIALSSMELIDCDGVHGVTYGSSYFGGNLSI